MKAETRPKIRSWAKFATVKAALKFAGKLYAAGAICVMIAAIYGSKQKRLFADWLLIKLVKTKSKRAEVRQLCLRLCDKRRGALLPEKDFGETHLYLMPA